MTSPLVTILCVSYNHAAFLDEAMTSIYAQTYQNIQVIAVDDGSSDGSQEVLLHWQKKQPGLELLLLAQNVGYCKAFNKGWALSRGVFIIDLAADDKLLPSRVEIGVNHLSSSKAGVQFSDAAYIDKESQVIDGHYSRDHQGKLLKPVPQGDIYQEVLKRYYICAPTMMIKREVLEFLDGYDENLHYEDFDFWVRSARDFNYIYFDQILVQKRVLERSMSKFQYTPNSPMLASTAIVCAKALKMNRNPQDNQALAVRIKYELRQAVIVNNYPVARSFLEILQEIEGNSWDYSFWRWLVSRQWNFTFLIPLIKKAR